MLDEKTHLPLAELESDIRQTEQEASSDPPTVLLLYSYCPPACRSSRDYSTTGVSTLFQKFKYSSINRFIFQIMYPFCPRDTARSLFPSTSCIISESDWVLGGHSQRLEGIESDISRTIPSLYLDLQCNVRIWCYINRQCLGIAFMVIAIPCYTYNVRGGCKR